MRYARGVEPVRRSVLRSRAVAAELLIRHAEREQPVRPVAQRDGDLRRRGAGLVRLDEVGRTFNVTRERIRQIENQSLKKLRALAVTDSLRDVA